VKAALELAWETPAEWGSAALADPLALLSDHAYCELGAAAAAQGLIARAPGDSELVERLGAHATEELRHFRAVHRVLVELGGTLGFVRRNAYAEALLADVQRGAAGLVDRLLVFALIERRSLERFELLARAAAEVQSPLGALYAELAPSEAGHAALFLELARARANETECEARFATWREREARAIRARPFGHEIHSGPLVSRGLLAEEVVR
jgi:tRNA-(ms[2]io[6]A)-hydroxylase